MFGVAPEKYLYEIINWHGTKQSYSGKIEYTASGIPGGEVWLLINVGLCVIS